MLMHEWTTIASVGAPGARHATIVVAAPIVVSVPATNSAQLELMFSTLLLLLLQLTLRLLYACNEM